MSIIRLREVTYYKGDKNQPIFLTLEVALNQIKAEPEKYVNNKAVMLERILYSDLFIRTTKKAHVTASNGVILEVHTQAHTSSSMIIRPQFKRRPIESR